jgi:hypothetical protein
MSAQSDPYLQQAGVDLDDDPGPATVRILPEDEVPEAATRMMSPDDPDYRPLQPGTLYTPAPQSAQSYDQPHLHYDHTPMQSSLVPAGRQLAVDTVEPEARGLQRGGDWPPPPGGSQPIIIKKGPSTCALLAGIAAFLLVSCAVLAYAGVSEGFDKLFGWIPNPFQEPKTVLDTSRPTIIESIKSVSELSTVKYQMEKIVVGTSTGVLPDWLVSDKLVLIAYGEVSAGIDLSEIKPEDIVVQSDTVRIRLPAPKIIYSKIDNGKTQVFERDTTIFTRADPNLETAVRAEAERQMVAGALENGILKQAQTNTELVLRELLEGLGYTNIRFVQTLPTLPTPPPSP